MFDVMASHTLKFCLAQPIAFILVVTFGAFDARTPSHPKLNNQRELVARRKLL
jgi:hypothetical protein